MEKVRDDLKEWLKRQIKFYKKKNQRTLLQNIRIGPKGISKKYLVHIKSEQGELEGALFEFSIVFNSISYPDIYLTDYEKYKGRHPNLYPTGKVCLNSDNWNIRSPKAFVNLLLSLRYWVEQPNFGDPTDYYLKNVMTLNKKKIKGDLKLFILQFCCTKTKDKYLVVLRKTSKNGKYEQISATPWGELKDDLTSNYNDLQFDAGEIEWSTIECPFCKNVHVVKCGTCRRLTCQGGIKEESEKRLFICPYPDCDEKGYIEGVIKKVAYSKGDSKKK